MDPETPLEPLREEQTTPAPAPEVSEPQPPFEQHPLSPRAWGYWELLYLVLFAVPAFLLVAIVCIGAFFGLSLVLGWQVAMDQPQAQAPLMIIIQVLWWALVLAYIYAVIAMKYALPFGRAIGWVSVAGSPTVYLAGGVFLAFSVAAASYVLPKPEGRLPIEALLEDPVAMVLLAIFGVLIAPAVEEIVFRGFVFPVVQRSHGTGMAILVTSVIFSLVHGIQYGWRWQNLLLLLAVGFVFGGARARTGSVIPSTLIHLAYNATLFAALFSARDQIKNL